MNGQYTVIDEFIVNSAKVLVLDKKRTLAKGDKYSLVMGENEYPYRLTHNDNWIIVDSNVSFKGKQIEM